MINKLLTLLIVAAAVPALVAPNTALAATPQAPVDS